MGLETFMKMGGEVFTVIRNGKNVGEFEGLRNTEKSSKRKYIAFYPDSDIQSGDFIIGKLSKDEYYIKDISSDIVHQKVLQIKGYYETKIQHEEGNKNEPNSIYNIDKVYGSIIGNQNNATINNSYNLEEIRHLIDKNGEEDKSELNEMINTLEAITKNNIPVQKGTLERFSELLAKHSWITGPIAQSILGWVIGQ